MACKGLRVLAMITYVLVLLLMSRQLMQLYPVNRMESLACHAKGSMLEAAETSHSAATQQTTLQRVSSRQGVQHLRVFVGVLSRTGSLRQRNAIRRTWGSDKRLARVMFFVLRPRSEQMLHDLVNEAATYGDVVLTPELESYYNTTYSVVNMFKVAAGMADHITHLLKTDEDVYVRIPLLLQTLQNLPRTWLYAGKVWETKVDRNPKYRWYVPESNYPSNDVIKYNWGMCSVLSVDLVKRLAAGGAYLSMPPNNMLWVEDVAVGVMVADVAKQQKAVVNYEVLRCSDATCSPDDIITANLKQPIAQALECMFQHSDQCCGNGTAVLPTAGYLWVKPS